MAKLTTDEKKRTIADAPNEVPGGREALEAEYGKDNVWDTKELREIFKVSSFLAPVCFVTKKSTGEKGAVLFQHNPRFYFGFQQA